MAYGIPLTFLPPLRNVIQKEALCGVYLGLVRMRGLASSPSLGGLFRADGTTQLYYASARNHTARPHRGSLPPRPRPPIRRLVLYIYSARTVPVTSLRCLFAKYATAQKLWLCESHDIGPSAIKPRALSWFLRLLTCCMINNPLEPV